MSAYGTGHEPNPSAIYDEAVEKAEQASRLLAEVVGLLWEVQDNLCALDMVDGRIYALAVRASNHAEDAKQATRVLQEAI